MKYAVIVNRFVPMIKHSENEMKRTVRSYKVGELSCDTCGEAQVIANILEQHYSQDGQETRVDACGVIYLDKGKAYLSTDRLRDLRDELNDAKL